MEVVIGKIKEALQQIPEVSAAYLFGSVAKGRYHRNSDIDIAILFIPGLSKMKRFDLRLDISGKLEDISGRPVDVVDLLESSLFLQHQVRKYGVLLLEKDPRYRVAYEVRSRREYFDLQPILERRNKALIGQIHN